MWNNFQRQLAHTDTIMIANPNKSTLKISYKLLESKTKQNREKDKQEILNVYREKRSNNMTLDPEKIEKTFLKC